MDTLKAEVKANYIATALKGKSAKKEKKSRFSFQKAMQ